uniref:Uncharacterized protein n=1 Tax=Neisseria meningitidis alpha275 TaxID=295996 RepID=C6SN39_NEIME|nr:hypothetical protein predicted by Glimmer/Critica [Neisseria meningitidis alpha275]
MLENQSESGYFYCIFRVLIQFAAGKGRFRFGKPLQTASNPMPSEAVSVVQYAPLPQTGTTVEEQ